MIINRSRNKARVGLERQGGRQSCMLWNMPSSPMSMMKWLAACRGLEGVATVGGMTGPQLSGLEMRVGRALPVLGKR